jgi:hypothetical protein
MWYQYLKDGMMEECSEFEELPHGVEYQTTDCCFPHRLPPDANAYYLLFGDVVGYEQAAAQKDVVQWLKWGFCKV